MGGNKQRRREQAIAALLSSSTVEDAARKAGVSVATLKRWLSEDEDFRREYHAARLAIVEGTTNLLLTLNTSAILTLAQNLRAPRPADSNRAAIAILDLSIRGVEQQQLKAELAELKAEFAEMKKETKRERPK